MVISLNLILGPSIDDALFLDCGSANSNDTQFRERYRETKEDEDCPSVQSVYLPPQSIIVMSGESRFSWTHGIDRVKEDIIKSDDGTTAKIARGERLSVTYRWLLPGADVVGS